MKDLRIIEPRTTRLIETRDKIEYLAYELSKTLDLNPKELRFFNEFSGKWEFTRHNYDNPDYEELEKITDRLYKICDYIDDEVLPTVQDRIEEEEAEESLIASVM